MLKLALVSTVVQWNAISYHYFFRSSLQVIIAKDLQHNLDIIKMEDYVRKTIVVGVVSWTTTFLVVRRIFPKRSFDFCTRIVSTLHATLAVTLASLCVQDWSCPICFVTSKSSPQEMQVLAVSLSYLIYDLVCSHFDERVNLDNTVHHLVSIVGIGAGLYYQKCGSEMVAAMWITEVSSPFLHFRQLLKELGYRDTLLNLIADILFAIIFTVARMLVGPCLTYVTLSKDYPLLIKAMGLGLQLVSAFWFFKILKMLKQKLTKRETSINGINHSNTNSKLQHG
ncbi:hypothetical protein RJT34_25761 [Clitoria ternatea]|uniref:TLC domain-containing protein n=1 Tax=Clitoria ternatea TaxID=43366 RepID=A0AAN9FQF2_CLITE